MDSQKSSSSENGARVNITDPEPEIDPERFPKNETRSGSATVTFKNERTKASNSFNGSYNGRSVDSRHSNKPTNPASRTVAPESFASNNPSFRAPVVANDNRHSWHLDSDDPDTLEDPMNDEHLELGLNFLKGTDHIFFKKCRRLPPEITTFDYNRRREVWNSSGRCIYYLGEKEMSWCTTMSLRRRFAYDLVDYTGHPVISVKGSQDFAGTTGEAVIHLGDGSLLGKISHSFLNSTYTIKDENGRIIFKIQAPCFGPCSPCVFWCCDEHFELCLDDGVTDVGKITKFWGNESPDFKYTLGISFNRGMNVKSKALVLGCFFLVEFQYYKNGGNGVLYSFIALLLLGFIVALILTNYFGLFH